MALKKAQEREYAKTLFLTGNYTQKEIAEKVGVQENTVKKWKDEEGWEKLKKSLLVTKMAQLANLYDQLEWQNKYIATRPIVYDIPAHLLKPTKLKDKEGNEYLEYPVYDATEHPIKQGNVATSKEADAIAKITASIQRLETETSLAEIVEVARDFIEFASAIDLVMAKKITKLFDIYITDKAK